MTIDQWRAIAALLRRDDDIELVPRAGGALRLRVRRSNHPSDHVAYEQYIALTELFAARDPVGYVEAKLDDMRREARA